MGCPCSWSPTASTPHFPQPMPHLLPAALAPHPPSILQCLVECRKELAGYFYFPQRIVIYINCLIGAGYSEVPLIDTGLCKLFAFSFSFKEHQLFKLSIKHWVLSLLKSYPGTKWEGWRAPQWREQRKLAGGGASPWLPHQQGGAAQHLDAGSRH